MKVTYESPRFLVTAKYEERELLKKFRFEWCPQQRRWYTTNPKAVRSFLRAHSADYDSETATKLENSLITIAPWEGPDLSWPDGLEAKAFQCQGAFWALDRNYSYIASDPGTGKTIMESLIINALPDSPVVVVNQPALVYNTISEFEKWVIGWKKRKNSNVLIIPDSMLHDPLGSRPYFDQVRELTKLGGATLLVDEAQRFNHEDSLRSQALFKLARFFDRVVFFSGTPLRNDRLMELWPIVSRFAPECIDFRSHGQYAFRYCEAYFDRWNKLKADGAANEEELFSNLKKTFMKRIRKEDVLTELPAKTEEIVFLSDELPTEVAQFERENLKKLSPRDLVKPSITQSPHLATYRRLLGRAILPLAVDFISGELERGNESFVIFGEHVEVMETLAKKLKEYNPIIISGKTEMSQRKVLADRFQEGKSRVFLGQVQACGLGFTLTKATRVIHVEPGWVPADTDQANDRTHRIGQTSPVHVQYLAVRNSLHCAILERQLEKRITLRKL